MMHKTLPNAVEIQGITSAAEARSHAAFNHIIDRHVYRRVKDAAQRAASFCVVDIPPFLVGYPAYNTLECMMYVVQALLKGGFRVQFVPPQSLMVSWWTPVGGGSGSGISSRKLLQQQQSAVSSDLDDPEIPFNFAAFQNKSNGKKAIYVDAE